MSNFRRALWSALRYWPSLVLATCCSIGVAALWGGNIGAVYPVIEVTLQGQSLQDWLAKEIATGEQRIDELQQASTALAEEQAIAKDPAILRSIQKRFERLQHEQQTAAASVRARERLLPWAERLLPRDPFHTVALVISVLLFSTLVKNLLIMVNDLLVARVAQSIARDVRMQIFNQAVKVDRAAFSGWGPSGFLSHITHTSHMLADGMMHVFGGAIREPLKGLSCLIGAGFICWRLLLMSLITAPLAGFTIVWVGKRLKGVSRRVLKRGHSYHEVMLETLNNIQTVQAYGMEADEQKRFADATAEMRRCSLQVTFYNTLTKPVTELVGIAMIGTAVIAGSYLVLSGDTKVWGIEITNRPLSVSSMLIFFGLLVGASDPVRKLSSVFAGIHTGAVAADHLYELLDYDSKIKEPAEPQSAPRPHREIVVHHLTFGYRHDSPVLRDAELRLPFGKTIAVVGANGSGKSTLVQLLCRFYDPQQGVITIDGVDLRRLSLRDLRSRIAVVSQRTELFNRSIMANILYGSPEATEEQARRAAQLAYAEDFIRHLPDGYATQVGTDGHRLSGGQRQRIALARAILRNPDLLILDEATSQIDMESEFLIRQSLAEFARGRSTLIITHREALLALADEVYQMEEGHLVRVPHQLGQQAA